MKHTFIPYLQWVCPAFESHLRVALGHWRAPFRELNKASLRRALPISFATLAVIWGAPKHFWKLLIFDNIFFAPLRNHSWWEQNEEDQMHAEEGMNSSMRSLLLVSIIWSGYSHTFLLCFALSMRTQDSETSVIHISLWESPSNMPQRDMHIWLFVCKIMKNLVGKSHSSCSCFLSNHKTNTVAHH